jgi:hypothetical protein
MKERTIVLALLVAALALPAAAAPPEKGTFGLAGALGGSFPLEGEYKVGFQLDASADYWFSKNVGGRVSAGYVRDGTDLGGSFSSGYFLGSAVYLFDLEDFRPYAIAGIGLYAVDPPVGGQAGRFGVHAGAGIEVALRRRVFAVAQLVFHGVGSVGDRKASFFGLTAGIRYYF